MPLGSQLNAALGAQGALAVLGDLTTGATATGTGASTAYAITAANTVFTTVAAGTGAKLPVTPTVSAKDRLHVANNGVNTLSVYPPTGGRLGTATANVPANVAPGKAAYFFCIDGTNYSAVLSA